MPSACRLHLASQGLHKCGARGQVAPAFVVEHLEVIGDEAPQGLDVAGVEECLEKRPIAARISS